MERAAFAAGHGWPVGKTPAARSAPSPSEGAALRVCSLWLLSLAQARESDSAARRADERAQGRESVFASATWPKATNSKKLVDAPRRSNDIDHPHVRRVRQTPRAEPVPAQIEVPAMPVA